MAAAANGAGPFNDFAAIRPHPSLNNNGQVTFSGQEKITFSNILITGIRPTFSKAALAQPVQPMIADNGNVVVRAGNIWVEIEAKRAVTGKLAAPGV
ncbi:MAG: hypothetical protein ACJ8G2_00745 [Burkholderiales bacterium]